MAEASSLESVTVIKSREHVYVFYFSTSLCLNDPECTVHVH